MGRAAWYALSGVGVSSVSLHVDGPGTSKHLSVANPGGYTAVLLSCSFGSVSERSQGVPTGNAPQGWSHMDWEWETGGTVGTSVGSIDPPAQFG